MRSMKAHVWDTGVFFSVLLLLINYCGGCHNFEYKVP